MTIKHIFTFVLFSAFCFQSIQAQNRVGIKVEYGMNSIQQESKYAISANEQLDYEISLLDVTPSQSIGIYSSFNFGYIFVQPEALYTSYSVKYQVEKFNDRRDVGLVDITEKIQQFDIPIFAGVRYKSLKIGAGPVFHIGEHIVSDFENVEKITISPNKLSAGLQAGFGIDFGFLTLDVKYQKDFNQISDHLKYNGANTGLRSRLSGLKIGVAMSIGR